MEHPRKSGDQRITEVDHVATTEKSEGYVELRSLKHPGREV
jgi:hypothetical protein